MPKRKTLKRKTRAIDLVSEYAQIKTQMYPLQSALKPLDKRLKEIRSIWSAQIENGRNEPFTTDGLLITWQQVIIPAHNRSEVEYYRFTVAQTMPMAAE